MTLCALLLQLPYIFYLTDPEALLVAQYVEMNKINGLSDIKFNEERLGGRAFAMLNAIESLCICILLPLTDISLRFGFCP